MEKISVIIPVYKVEKYLDKCVDSVVNQTYKNLEIILVDDGSPDNCPQMCDEWAERDNRIKVIHKANRGLSDARNVGLDNSTGDFILFLDSDDYVSPTMCERLLQLQQEYSSDMVACDLLLFYEDDVLNIPRESNPQIRLFEGDSVIEYLYKNDIPLLMVSCAKLYKNNLFNNIRFPIGKLHEDEFVFHKILGNSSSFVYTNEKLYYYLQRSQSITGTRSIKSYQCAIEAYADRFNYLQENFNQNYEKNVNLYLAQLRNTYMQIKLKDLKKELLKTYKNVYRLIKKHTIKDFLFLNLRSVYGVLAKVKRG